MQRPFVVLHALRVFAGHFHPPYHPKQRVEYQAAYLTGSVHGGSAAEMLSLRLQLPSNKRYTLDLYG